MTVERNGGLSVDVTVKPGGSREFLEWDGSEFTVKTRAKPVEGQANRAVIEALAEFLDIPKSRINIETGGKSRKKRVFLSGATARWLADKTAAIVKKN